MMRTMRGWQHNEDNGHGGTMTPNEGNGNCRLTMQQWQDNDGDSRTMMQRQGQARNNEMTQQGAPMCDTNAMIQAQQQQMSYLPPNYLGLIWWVLIV
uniref:Uncharacterized protein n=1 Tax=Romanomermis culicivorax TaxID=13658 RepID=A0A915J7W0_ROMCU